MVRALLVLAVVSSLAAPAPAQQQHEYWLVGVSEDNAGRYTLADYVDAASISAPTPDVRRAWTWTFFAPYSTHGYAGEHSVSLREFNCASRQMRILQSTHYTTDEWRVRPSSPRPWEYVTPGTMGEFELNFVCSALDARRRRAIRVDAGLTPADHAATVFAPR